MSIAGVLVLLSFFLYLGASAALTRASVWGSICWANYFTFVLEVIVLFSFYTYKTFMSYRASYYPKIRGFFLFEVWLCE